MPPGVVNVVAGFGGIAGAALTEHMDVDKVSFTGSCQTGQRIIQASARNVKRVTLELGGKSPDIVFADAELGAAVAGAAMGVFANSGQVCSAGARLFIERPIFEEFSRRVAEYGNALRIGDPMDAEMQIGPLVSQVQLDRVCGYLALGVEEGARAISGGKRLTDGAFARGFYVPPTVFVDVRDSMRIAREEIFGPVIKGALHVRPEGNEGFRRGVAGRMGYPRHRLLARTRLHRHARWPPDRPRCQDRQGHLERANPYQG